MNAKSLKTFSDLRNRLRSWLPPGWMDGKVKPVLWFRSSIYGLHLGDFRKNNRETRIAENNLHTMILTTCSCSPVVNALGCHVQWSATPHLGKCRGSKLGPGAFALY